MGMQFGNWADEGYYEYDDFCGYTKVTNEARKEQLRAEDKLLYSDGSGFDNPQKVDDD